MEPELCPPWWPSLIWELLRRHHIEPPPPEPEEWLKRVGRPIEELLGALAVYTEAHAFLGDKHEFREQAQHVAVEQMNHAVKQLAGITESTRA